MSSLVSCGNRRKSPVDANDHCLGDSSFSRFIRSCKVLRSSAFSRAAVAYSIPLGCSSSGVVGNKLN